MPVQNEITTHPGEFQSKLGVSKEIIQLLDVISAGIYDHTQEMSDNFGIALPIGGPVMIPPILRYIFFPILTFLLFMKTYRCKNRIIHEKNDLRTKIRMLQDAVDLQFINSARISEGRKRYLTWAKHQLQFIKNSSF